MKRPDLGDGSGGRTTCGCNSSGVVVCCEQRRGSKGAYDRQRPVEQTSKKEGIWSAKS